MWFGGRFRGSGLDIQLRYRRECCARELQRFVFDAHQRLVNPSFYSLLTAHTIPTVSLLENLDLCPLLYSSYDLALVRRRGAKVGHQGEGTALKGWRR